jgi:hypothetical protein
MSAGTARTAVRVFSGAVALAAMVFVAACNPPSNPGGEDATGPTFTKAAVRVEGPGAPVHDFDIITNGANQGSLASVNTLHLIVTAADPESGITSVTISSNLTWQCSVGSDSEIIGTPNNVPLPFTAPTSPASAVTAFGIDSTVDPIAATGCAVTSRPGSGPINIRGFIQVTATNGAKTPAAVTSMRFTFDYADVGRAH